MTAVLTWALVGLRVTLWHRGPGVRGCSPSLGALWIGGPVVVGAARGVCVPRRPRVITIASLEEKEQNFGGNLGREEADREEILYGDGWREGGGGRGRERSRKVARPCLESVYQDNNMLLQNI